MSPPPRPWSVEPSLCVRSVSRGGESGLPSPPETRVLVDVFGGFTVVGLSGKLFAINISPDNKFGTPSMLSHLDASSLSNPVWAVRQNLTFFGARARATAWAGGGGLAGGWEGGSSNGFKGGPLPEAAYLIAMLAKKRQKRNRPIERSIGLF